MCDKIKKEDKEKEEGRTRIGGEGPWGVGESEDKLTICIEIKFLVARPLKKSLKSLIIFIN
jgi:hypothetical protein